LRRRGALLRFAAAHVVAAAHATTIAATQHLHFIGDDVDGVAFDAVLVRVLAVLQATFDVDRLALLQVLAGDFRQSVVEGDAVPLGFFDRFAAGLVLAAAGRGDADRADGGTAGCVAHLGIAATVADEDDFVD